MGEKYDFSGWATKNDLLCADGRTIRKDAFKDCDGKTVPLVWNHNHNEPENVLGHALLENRPDGVYAYCAFNDTEAGNTGKKIVQHHDVKSLSIYANQLKQIRGDVIHGTIREVSLVLAGANPGAYIDSVMAHSADTDEDYEKGIILNYDEDISLEHSDEGDGEMAESESKASETENDSKSKEDTAKETEQKESKKTAQEILDSFNSDQKDLYEYMTKNMYQQGFEDGKASKSEDESKDSKEKSDEGEKEMKHNIFDNDNKNTENTLSHSDEQAIVNLAKQPNVGSLQSAVVMYAEENSLQHGIDDIETLFPEYKDVRPGAPELITRDQGWVTTVMNKASKSPISRIRTRQADARGTGIRAFGYQKNKEKKYIGNIKLLNRTTDPQTVTVKDSLHRDDIIDITDFDVVEYQYNVMRMTLNEELALAAMVGDGRDDGAEDKIDETHIRSIWHDDDLYTIHKDVDIAAAKKELQGTGTATSFGDNYVYAEAILQSLLYARETFKGTGTPDFYCTPHLLNVMLLARDMNGRRIYDSVTDLARAMNVGSIYTAEQFEGLTRTTSDSKKKKLLGIVVNMNDYQFGSTKGGEITRFNQFDIDFNKEKYLIETRVSGALTRIYSAIALEEDTTTSGS